MNSTPPASRGWIDRFAILRQAWPWLAALLFGAAACKWISLATTAPHGPGSLVRFTLVTVVLCSGPGLFALRRFPDLDASRLGQGLWVVLISLGGNILAVWLLYTLGLYTPAATWAVVTGSAVLGVLGARALRPAAAARAFHDWWISQPVLDRVVFAVLALDLALVCLQTAGTHFWAWDSIVSWDKWGCDMAERTGLGRYVMGGYPQMLPALYSVTYKLAGTWLQGLPDEQLLLHGLNAAFAVLLLAGLIRLCAVLRVRGSLAAVVLVGNQHLRGWFDLGYADIPATAVAIGSLALLLGRAQTVAEMNGRSRRAAGWLLALPVFLMGFSKAQGLLYALLGFGAALWLVPAGSRRSLAAALGPGLAAGFVLVAPFYAHQLYYSRHSDRADPDPRCHTMIVEAAKPKLIDVSWARALEQGEDLAKAYRQMPALNRIDGSLYGAVFWSAVLAAAFIRRLRVVAVMAAAGYLLWFFTVSYDWRNAFVPLALFAVMIAGTVTALADRWRKPAWAGSVLMALAVLFFGTGWAWTVAKSGSGWRQAVFAPPMWRTELEGRFQVASPGFRVVRVFLQESPLGRRANRIYCANILYRYLGDKGVYTLKGNSFTDVRPGDLLLHSDGEPFPQDFVPVAKMQSLVYDTLAMVAPGGEPVDVDIRPGAGMRVTGDSAEGFTLAGTGMAELFLNLPFNLAGQSVVLFRIDYEPADADIGFSLSPEWEEMSVLGTRLLFHTHQGQARGLVWLDKLHVGQALTAPRPIRLEKQTAEDVRIRRVLVESVPPAGLAALLDGG